MQSTQDTDVVYDDFENAAEHNNNQRPAQIERVSLFGGSHDKD